MYMMEPVRMHVHRHDAIASGKRNVHGDALRTLLMPCYVRVESVACVAQQRTLHIPRSAKRTAASLERTVCVRLCVRQDAASRRRDRPSRDQSLSLSLSLSLSVTGVLIGGIILLTSRTFQQDRKGWGLSCRIGLGPSQTSPRSCRCFHGDSG
jgi:hypothetical protein